MGYEVRDATKSQKITVNNDIDKAAFILFGGSYFVTCIQLKGRKIM